MKKTFEFKLYKAKRNAYLHDLIGIANEIYNYCISFHKTYYRLYKKHLDKHKLQKYLTRLKRRPEYSHWNLLGSQALQDITDRIDRAYKTFFILKNKRRRTAAPSFIKNVKYKSFTLKQAGYALLDENKMRIGKHIFKFHKSREVEGTVCTVTIKRDSLGDLYVYLSCQVLDMQPKETAAGKSVGFDFGLKTFLTVSDGQEIEAPLFLRRSMKMLKKLGKKLSTKQRGSNNRKRARIDLARMHKKITNQRKDFHFKCARQLAQSYETLFFEDLNIAGMHKLWGRKISDLGFAQFLKILTYQCQKTGAQVKVIDRFYPSSKQCHNCFAIKEDLSLSDRSWQCMSCFIEHQRDLNAAINIARVGASTLGLGNVRPTRLAIAA